MMIDQMIMEARSMGCSDIHITVGMPLMYRINGRLQNAPTNPSDGEIIAMLAELLTDEQRENLERGIDADFAIRTPDGNRQRVNVFKQEIYLHLAVHNTYPALSTNKTSYQDIPYMKETLPYQFRLMEQMLTISHCH